MGPMGFQPGLIARIAASVSEAWYLLFSADNPGSCAKHVFLPSSLFSFIFCQLYIYTYVTTYTLCDQIRVCFHELNFPFLETHIAWNAFE